MASFPTLNNLWTSFTAYDDIQVVADHKSVNQKVSVTTGDNMKLNIKASTRPLTATEARKIQAFFKEVRGRGQFTLNLVEGTTSCPTLFNYTGSAAVPNLVYKTSGTHAIGSTQITLDTVTTEALLPTGSYVQFREGGKIHQVISSSGSVITVMPSLYEEVPSTTSLLIKNLVGTFRMMGGAPTASQEYVHRFSYSFDFEEELP